MSKQDLGLLRAMGGHVGRFLDDLFPDDLFPDDDDQARKTRQVERKYAIVDLMMLAILADGAQADSELDVLEAQLLDAPELGMTLAEAKSRIAFKAKQIDTPQKMRMAIRASVARLPDPDDRALAYQLAAQLRQAGARLGTRRGGYRANLLHDDGLLQLFGETLGIAAAERERLESAPLVMPER